MMPLICNHYFSTSAYDVVSFSAVRYISEFAGFGKFSEWASHT
jgi:hypothetical protein